MANLAFCKDAVNYQPHEGLSRRHRREIHNYGRIVDAEFQTSWAPDAARIIRYRIVDGQRVFVTRVKYLLELDSKVNDNGVYKSGATTVEVYYEDGDLQYLDEVRTKASFQRRFPTLVFTKFTINSTRNTYREREKVQMATSIYAVVSVASVRLTKLALLADA